ncbi:hypothetical protein BLNAU_21565 [Blattamonas nauphoetae]|uniref:Uncharacterized protein n=1 Tax=Blattamonas nauphoetae TaxID=2049346 RepID=A0ABQ9WYL6_9EUKA|nr:hypothetical protein BLNAU_21565 [Blattamonas nauphoetae]
MGSTSAVSISESKFTECHTLDEDYVEHNDPANPGAEPNLVHTRGVTYCSCANGSGASVNARRLTPSPSRPVASRISWHLAIGRRRCCHWLVHFRCIRQGIVLQELSVGTRQCAGVMESGSSTSNVAITRFLNCSFIGCCDSKAETTIVVGLDGSSTQTLEISKSYVIQILRQTRRLLLLSGSFASPSDLVTFSDCCFLSASPHLLHQRFRKMDWVRNSSSVEGRGWRRGGFGDVWASDRKCLTLRHAATLCRATEGTEDMISVIVGEGNIQKRRSLSGTLSITSVSFFSNENQATLSSPIISIAAGSATLDSCDLHALLFSNKEASIDVSSDSIVASSGSVELVDCSLSNIALTLSLLRGSGDLSLGGCTFTSLFRSVHTEDYSHVFDVTISEVKSQRIWKSTSNSKTLFVSCSSKEDGGGLKMCVSGSGVVELAEVHISKCSSFGNGGALLIEVASRFAGAISFASVEFGTGDDKNTATLGTDLFVTAADLSTLINTEGFLTLRPALPQDGTFGKEEKNELMGKAGDKAIESLLFIWYPHTSGDKHVEGTTGEDHENYGLLQLHCLSLSTTYRSLNETNQTISIDSSFTLADSIAARSTGFVLTSTLPTPPTLTIASVFSFLVSVGPTELSSLSFVPKEETGSTLLFSISDSGTLLVRSCSFSSFQSTSSPSILFGSVGFDQSVSLDSITFTSCSSSGQVSSGVISLSLRRLLALHQRVDHNHNLLLSTADSDFLFLSRPTFTQYYVSTALSLAWNKDDTTARSFVGKEGSHSPNVPLYLFLADLDSEGHLSNASSDISMITRLSSVASPSVQLDTDLTQTASQSFISVLTIQNDRMLIIADPSTELVSSDSLQSVLATGQLKMEGSTILLKEGTISGCIVKISEAVEVDSNGETFTKCGHFLLFCSSMELGVNRLVGADLEKIRVMESIQMDFVVSLEGDITICGSTKESTLLFTPTGRFENELHNGIASSLSIDSLIISFPSTAPSNPLFVSSCGLSPSPPARSPHRFRSLRV